MSDSLRDRIARVLNRELLAQLPDAVSNGGDLAPSPSGTINLEHLAAVVIAELGCWTKWMDTVLLDFGLWLSEELTGNPMSRTDLMSCLTDWKADDE